MPRLIIFKIIFAFKMKILVLGSSGFIGKHLTSFLEDKGYEIYKGVRSECNTYPGKIHKLSLTESVVSENFSHYDAIIHLATIYPTKDRDKKGLFSVNTGSVAAIIDNLIEDLHKRHTKLIYFSAMSMFRGYDEAFINSSSRPVPKTDYDASKAASEIMVKRYKNGINIRIPFVLEKGCSRSWINNVIEKADRDEIIQICNPNHLYNHLVDFRTIESAVIKALDNSFNGGPVICLGSKNPITILSLVRKLIDKKQSNSIVNIVSAGDLGRTENTPIIDVNEAASLGINISKTEDILDNFFK